MLEDDFWEGENKRNMRHGFLIGIISVMPLLDLK